MRKILHVITGLEDGGAEAALFRLCIYDSYATHIVVSLMGLGKYGELLAETGVEVHSLSMSRGRISLRAFHQLRMLIREIGPDAVQTWMYHATLMGSIAAFTLRHPNIVWGIRHSVLSPGVTSRSTFAVVKVLKAISGFVPHRIIYCAEAARHVHESLGFTSSKGVTIPNGYDLALFSPSKEKRTRVREELGIGEDVLVFGNVARWHPDKDHRTLIKALGMLKQQKVGFEFLFVGSDLTESNEECMRLIDKANIRQECHLLGRRNDIDVIMTALDFHVLSSSSEAFPNVLAEAMASGTPCISTNVGDASEILGGTGWIVDTGDTVGLSTRLREAAESRGTEGDLKRRIAARARVVSNYSIEDMINSYYSLAWRISS